MRHKTFLAVLSTCLLLAVLAPLAAFASDEAPFDVNVYYFDDRGKDVIITFDDGKKLISDDDTFDVRYGRTFDSAFSLYTNENIEDCNRELVIDRKILDYPAFDSVLYITVHRPGHDDFTYQERYKEDQDEYDSYNDDRDGPNSHYYGPRDLEFVPTTLYAGQDDQDVSIRYGRGYVAGSADCIRLVPFDKDGKVISGKATIRLYLRGDSYATDERRVIDFSNLDVPSNADYYRIEYFSESNKKGYYIDRLQVVDDRYQRLELDYGTKTIKEGGIYQPKVYAVDKDGKRKDVTGEATFVFSDATDALMTKGTETGVFKVKDDAGAYYGKKLGVTAHWKGKRATAEFTITGPESVATSGSVTVKIGSKEMMVNGRTIILDTPPVVSGSRTFVPLRAVAEAFGVKVDYNNDTRLINCFYTKPAGLGSMVLTVGSKNLAVTKPGTIIAQTSTMDVEPYIANGRTMIPIRYLSGNLGFTAEPYYNADGTTAGVVFKAA